MTIIGDFTTHCKAHLDQMDDGRFNTIKTVVGGVAVIGAFALISRVARSWIPLVVAGAWVGTVGVAKSASDVRNVVHSVRNRFYRQS